LNPTPRAGFYRGIDAILWGYDPIGGLVLEMLLTMRRMIARGAEAMRLEAGLR